MIRSTILLKNTGSSNAFGYNRYAEIFKEVKNYCFYHDMTESFSMISELAAKNFKKDIMEHSNIYMVSHVVTWSDLTELRVWWLWLLLSTEALSISSLQPFPDQQNWFLKVLKGKSKMKSSTSSCIDWSQ